MPETFTSSDLATAQNRLSDYILDEADKLERRLYFCWQPAADAPVKYTDLCGAFEVSQKDGRPLPVSNENSGSVVFGLPEVNMAYRYVHDVAHVEQGLNFSSPDEFELARWQMRRFERAGFNRNDLEWQLFQADAVGHVLYYAVTKQFVSDQLQFALDCVRHGMDKGLYLEMERQK